MSLVAPVLISWLKSDRWSKLARAGFAILVSLLLGTATAYANGETGGSFYMTIAAIVIATQAFWRIFVKDTGLEEVLNPDE